MHHLSDAQKCTRVMQVMHNASLASLSWTVITEKIIINYPEATKASLKFKK